jgi:hypothetical protein
MARTHFHIRWSNISLYRERFDSREEAEAYAKRLVRQGETFTVEEHDEGLSEVQMEKRILAGGRCSTKIQRPA